jgi:hypothetical protein
MKGLSSHERVVVSFIVLTPPLFYFCPIPGSGFPVPYVVALCLCSMISGVRSVDSFVDISGIVDHHCLIFFCFFSSYTDETDTTMTKRIRAKEQTMIYKILQEN